MYWILCEIKLHGFVGWDISSSAKDVSEEAPSSFHDSVCDWDFIASFVQVGVAYSSGVFDANDFS